MRKCIGLELLAAMSDRSNILFLSLNDQVQIAEAESTLVAERSVLPVLNTLLFFPLEYFGEVGGFYSKLQTAKFGAKKGACD